MQTITINNRTWTKRDSRWQYDLWNSGYICADGDGAELLVSSNAERLELSCFSGSSTSEIVIDALDFQSLCKRVEIDYTDDFETQCIRIADYFCRLFCEWKETN